MNKTLVILLVSMLVMSISLSAGNDRKAERMARREARRQERALYDSLRLKKLQDDSVNIGYGYVKKKNLTGSVSKVDIDEAQMAGYVNIGEYLRGRVPGLQVMKVGGTYKYLIRGISSINSPTDPLFVVDGVEMMSIDHLNPNEIRTVEVLKDASASIYGNRGACGVIIITTKGF